MISIRKKREIHAQKPNQRIQNKRKKYYDTDLSLSDLFESENDEQLNENDKKYN